LVNDHSGRIIVGESGGAHLISGNNSRGHGGDAGQGHLWGSLGASDSCHEDRGGTVGEVRYGSLLDGCDYVRWRCLQTGVIPIEGALARSWNPLRWYQSSIYIGVKEAYDARLRLYLAWLPYPDFEADD